MNESYALTWDLFSLLLLSTALAMGGATAGVFLSDIPDIGRRIVPFSGALLLILTLFFVLPELSARFGWQTGPALILTGFVLIWMVDRFVYPVCPACSDTHDHGSCITRLHGFAAPLIAAALVHNSFDGWTLAAGHEFAAVGGALVAGVLIHKLPESIAYGVILQASLGTRKQAILWALAAQSFTFTGALLEILLAPTLGSQWMSVLLGLGGGTFLYLGYHAVQGEWKRRVARRAVRIS